MYGCMDVWGCMNVWMYECMDVCVHVWKYVCMCGMEWNGLKWNESEMEWIVRMCVCMYVCICMCVCM